MKNISLLLFTVIFSLTVNAQQLLSPSFTFSKKKTSYITLEDGTEIKGTITGIKRKKGLIKLISLEDESGKKHKLEPSSVKYMYLPPSGLDKLSKALDFASDAQKWNDEKLDQDVLNQGYVYFETVNVKIKKKTMPMLMQLLNPGFSKTVKVYHDPFAKETASAGVGGITVVGGIAKSYYVMVDGDQAAYKLEKKTYKKSFATLWDKCSSLASTADVKWNEFTDHIIKYTECE